MSCPFCPKGKSCGNSHCSYSGKKIKMYRHTIKSTEYLGDDEDFVSYHQTDWSSIANYIPEKGNEIVLTEEKEIEEKK